MSSSAPLNILDLYRHASTADNEAQRVAGGYTDTPLSTKGEQACLATHLILLLKGVSTTYNLIYHPKLQRVCRTIELLGLRGPLQPTDALRECHWGAYEGRLYNDPSVQTAFQRIKTDLDWAPPRGETQRQFRTRIHGFLLPRVSRFLGRRTAIASSFGAIRALLVGYFDLPHPQGFSIGVPNCSITRIHLDRPRVVAEAVEHFDPRDPEWRPGFCPIEQACPLSTP